MKKLRDSNLTLSVSVQRNAVCGFCHEVKDVLMVPYSNIPGQYQQVNQNGYQMMPVPICSDCCGEGAKLLKPYVIPGQV